MHILLRINDDVINDFFFHYDSVKHFMYIIAVNIRLEFVHFTAYSMLHSMFRTDIFSSIFIRILYDYFISYINYLLDNQFYIIK